MSSRANGGFRVVAGDLWAGKQYGYEGDALLVISSGPLVTRVVLWEKHSNGSWLHVTLSWSKCQLTQKFSPYKLVSRLGKADQDGCCNEE